MFPSDYNKIFYSQQAFVFQLLKNVCNVHNHIVAFFRRKNLFRLEKENNAIKDNILRDIKNFFQHEGEENYYKTGRVIFRVTVIMNMKVTTIETKHYQLKNIFIKLDHV